jgi:hypothetical protein
MCVPFVGRQVDRSPSCGVEHLEIQLKKLAVLAALVNPDQRHPAHSDVV